LFFYYDIFGDIFPVLPKDREKSYNSIIVVMKNIVTIGGGTGTFTVLTALKKYPVHLTAIVSMADDGGSTGRLRDQYGVLPPGDVRRALVALSESSDTMRELFNYRFNGGGLQGHSFGNLFLTALEKVTGNFASAVEEASHILNVNGEVAPVTLDDVRLCARLANGSIIRGETNIDIPRVPHRSPIEEVWLEPEARMNPSLKRILKNADSIIMGPGDLYTSIIPNFLVPGVREEIKRSKAKKVFICNLMTKAGETDGFSAEDFLGVMEKYLGKNVLDFVIFNNKRPSERLLRKYRREGAEFVAPPLPKKGGRGPEYILGDFIDTDTFVRHGPLKKMGKLLVSL
jgi:uncharacterized cofD-like protein